MFAAKMDVWISELLMVLCVLCLTDVNGARLACYSSLTLGKPCDCNLESTRPTVTCRSKGLTEVVVGIPSNIVVLDLSSNAITEIREDAFLNLEKLQTLFLMNNNIESIHPKAFRNMFNLKLIVLNKNKLTSIPADMFQHLPNLNNINLRRNRITSISRHAFITLPLNTEGPVTVELNENQIHCDCDTKALKTWMITNPGKLYLNGAICNNTRDGLQIVNTPNNQFPPCNSQEAVIPDNASCYTCNDAVNHQQCRLTGQIKTCRGNEMVCSSRITSTDGKFAINKGCMWYQSCLNQERANVRGCGLYNKPDRLCNFCCIGEECNAGDMGGRTKELKFSLKLSLDRSYNQDLDTVYSEAYLNEQRSLTTGLTGALNEIAGGYTVDIQRFSQPMITVWATIYSTNLNTRTEDSVLAQINETLRRNSLEGALSEMGVVPSTILLNYYKIAACFEEIIKTSVGIFTWPQTDVGYTTYINCPNNQLISVSRQCHLNASGKPIWMEPLITDCLINSTVNNKLNNLLKININAGNVRQALDNLKTLTKDTRNFNKKQLSLAVGVLTNILKEESSYSNRGIMNDTVAVVSQLLFIPSAVLLEAQDEFDTSTRILDSVEKISNKISLSNGNITIIEPNLVLAAVPVAEGYFNGLSLSTRSQAKGQRLSVFTLNDGDDESSFEENDDTDNTQEMNDDPRNTKEMEDDSLNTKEDLDEDPMTTKELSDDSPSTKEISNDTLDTMEMSDDPRYTKEMADDPLNTREVTDNPFNTSEIDDDKTEEEVDDDSRHTRDSPDVIDDDDDGNAHVNKFVLPKTLFTRLTTAEKTSLERITFNVFPTGKLFSSMKNDKNAGNPTSLATGDKTNLFVTQVNSGVIAASIPHITITNLTDPVRMTFSHSSPNSSGPQCVFWYDGRNGGPERWSSEGCSVLNNVQGSYTTCVCNHLTNFALLMDVYQDGHAISKTDQRILSIISYIGCSLSFICLILTLLTYLLFNGPAPSTDSTQFQKSDSFGQSFRKLRKDNPSKILVNLCLALAIADLVFIVGMHSYAMDNSVGCKTVAVLLHYFLLAALTWMAVEAFYMYLALVLVFKTYYSNFMLKCCIVGWGIPLVIVAITLGINNTDNYNKLDSGVCWLTPYAFYGAFAGPVLFVLLINFIAFALVLRQLCGLQAKKLTKSDRSDKLSKLRGAVGVVILLGLTWIFAIFAIGPLRTVFSYLFAIFNALQGLFIFVFYCVFKRDALNSWRRLLPCCEVIDEKSSSRGYSATAPATINNNQTLSTLRSITEGKKRDSSDKYQVKRENDVYNRRYSDTTSSSYI
ncbi:uncharacterized protein LOC126811152 isoform X2 [Patella vulgata]|uniref:uncharacterized protein LOC126811152 isoform X2 n=1 Tax=Patella vulgata TaxID=6465 RepID=UPI0021800DD7|nr:uncharacterized protein LOC126811152 isoform X2 [Patella vulgata]